MARTNTLLKLFILSVSTIPLELQAHSATRSILDQVDVFIGTGSHGHTFPHAMVPFGMVAPGPDCNNVGWDAASGYHYDAPTILGFSQTHLSGTGLIALGDVLFMPNVGKVQYVPGPATDPNQGYRSRFSHDKEKASPGYYQVRLLDNDINVELTASERVAFHKYSFPQNKQRRSRDTGSRTYHRGPTQCGASVFPVRPGRLHHYGLSH